MKISDLWTPGGRVNVDVVGVERECPGLHGIVHHPVQHPHAAWMVALHCLENIPKRKVANLEQLSSFLHLFLRIG